MVLGALLLPAAAQAQATVDCISSGRLQYLGSGRSQVPGNLGGGKSVGVQVSNPQMTPQTLSVSYLGRAAFVATNVVITVGPYSKKTQWVATLRGSTPVSDEEIRANTVLSCYLQ